MEISVLRSRTDSGITLVELLVYGMLMVVVLAVVAGMFVSSTTTTQTVSRVTVTASEGQLVADSVATGIRNSSDFSLTLPSGNDQLLVARVAGGEDELVWGCAAWYYSALGGGSIRFTRSNTLIVPPTAEPLDWTLLSKGIVPASGTTVFSADGEKLTVAFTGLAGDSPPVLITSTASSRAGASGSVACF